jgi:hypothetical protein
MYHSSIQTAADHLPSHGEISQICEQCNVRIVEFTEPDGNGECWTDAHVELSDADEATLLKLGYIDISLDADLSLHIELV